jgi:uncharacterized protein YndB with AHSA1/START domain
MTRFGVMKHLGVLADAGLVLVRRRGRERWNHLNPIPIQELHRRWILPFAAHRAGALLRLRDVAERPPGDPMPIAATYDVLELELEVEIAADRATVWAALTDGAGAWWPQDFYSHPAPRDFRIEPRPGGRMWEDWGDGQGMLWATVTTVRNEELLELSGELTPAFGGPARTLQRFELVEADGGTTLKLSDCVYGSVSAALKGQLEAGWKALLEGGLKAHLEG